MRVTKDQIVNGVVTFIETEVIPQISDRSTQFVMGVAVNAVKANKKLVDSIFANQLVKIVLDESADGTYELDNLLVSINDSIRQYGPVPVEIPSIPLISPAGSTLKFSESDIAEIKRRIERST